MAKEREAFNFYKSYYEVYMQLSAKDKVLFMDALLERQFKGIEPTGLDGMVNFAYLSQKHSIDKQVKGWEDKMKRSLNTPTEDPCQGGTEGGCQDPCQQEKGEEKEKGKEQKVDVKGFLTWFNKMRLKYKGAEGKFKVISDTDKNNLKKLKDLNYTSEEWEYAFKMMCNSEWVQKNDMVTPKHFLVNTNFDKYLNQGEASKQTTTVDPLVERAKKLQEQYGIK